MDKKPVILRVFGRRKGRPLRKTKSRLMKELLPRVLAGPPSSFDSSKEKWLEIGFGSGEHLADQAQNNPHVQCIGCEVFENAIASLLRHIEEKNLRNIWIYPEDVRRFLQEVPSAFFSRIFMMFPDPWPKKKHRKRRLADEAFLNDLFKALTPQGQFFFASDHFDYVIHVKDILGTLFPLAQITLYDTKPLDWPLTLYNQKALQADMPSWYLHITNI